MNIWRKLLLFSLVVFLQKFLLPLYTLTAGNNRHGRRTVSRQFPNGTDTKPQQKRYTFGASVPFGAPEKRERKAKSVKGLPHGDAQEFCRSLPISSHSKLLRAFDRQSRSPTIPKPKGTKMSCEGNKMRGLFRFYQHELRFCWGLLTAAFVVKREGMW